MIKAFLSTDKDYTTNGDAVISASKARVKNSDNGDFYLELVCGSEYNDFIEANNILVVPTPKGEQAFRIRSVKKKNNTLEVKAWHVFYDSQNYLIADSYAVNSTCKQALQRFNAATDVSSPFRVDSDINVINNLRCVRKSLYEAVNNVLERWGGHLVRDNWDIKVLSSTGTDNGITIEYRKNLKELTASYDWSKLVTKVMPVGKDGILLDELYLYSNIQYDIPYTKAISFDQSSINEADYTSKEEYTAALKADLKAQAAKYLLSSCYPVVNYDLKGNPEKVTDIGDTIEVKDERIGVNILTEVIAYEYDAITGNYVSLTFGNFKDSLGGLLNNISNNTATQVNNAVVTITSNISEAIAAAQAAIFGTLKNSYCIYEGDKILIVDRIPARNATNVIKVDKTGVSFSTTGIDGEFTLVWGINGELDANILVNLTADLIKGGTLSLENGKISIIDDAGGEFGTIDKNGLKVYDSNGGYTEIGADGLRVMDADGDALFNKNGSLIRVDHLYTRALDLPDMYLRGMMIYRNVGGTTILNDGVGLV